MNRNTHNSNLNHPVDVKEDDTSEEEEGDEPCRRRRRRSSRADAARALARVEAKLTGLEGGEVLGVSMHVNKLIEAAQDIHHLAHIYAGWSPWI